MDAGKEQRLRKFDIVIIGSGAAGMMAAWKVAKAGFACAVLEKGRHIASSNAARCGGPALADTRLQKEENAAVTREQLFSHMYEFSRGTVHAGLLRNAVGKGREARARHFFRTPVNKRWKRVPYMIIMEDLMTGMQERQFIVLQKTGDRRI